ncbi:ankyrin repeat-containing domain protein [Xylariaceae sp. FL1651]|nr:ankyrin repeat-containing domain protein [Xylariaceae sp. FL1651]
MVGLLWMTSSLTTVEPPCTLVSSALCVRSTSTSANKTLKYAVQKNHVRACQFLLQVGADRFIEDESGMSATQRAWEHIFTKRGAPEVLDAFRRMFPDVDLECWQFSPLHQAVLGVEGFSLPAQLKTDAHPGMINATDARGRTALHWAALRGDLEAVELLLDAGADVDVVDEFKCTPLLYAVSSAKPRMIELLILRKADVNFANNRGDTPLHYAARHRDDVESVKVLVQAGARVDCKNSLGNTPFAGAAITNRLSSGKYLLQNGADRYSRNKYGDTPLRETVHHNCHEFLRMLLQTGTRYDDINRSGTTILHALALEGDRETAEILKTFKMTGLDTQLRNAKGKTAMDVCQERVGAPEGFKDAFSELWASLNATS